jgi:hypothetical protein
MGFFSSISSFVSNFFSEFGGQDIEQVFSTASSLMEANYDERKDAALFAVLSREPVAYTIMDTGKSGSAAQIDAIKVYAENHYPLGLPTGTKGEALVLNDNVVASAIQDDLDLAYEVLIDINFLVILNRAHIALPYLIENRNLDVETLIITSYPSEMSLLSTYNTFPVTNTVYINSINIDSSLSVISINYRIERYYTTDSTDYSLADDSYTELYSVPSGYTLGNLYCIAAYQETDGSGTPIGNTEWWFYDTTTNVYPNISEESATQNNDVYLPIVPLRYENSDLTVEGVQDTELFKTSKFILNKFGLDIFDLTDTINSNPNINDIDNAYFMWGIDFQTDENESIRYLVEFFDYLSDLSEVSLLDVLAAELAGEPIPQNIYGFNQPPPASSLTTYGLNSSVTYSGISSEIKTGNIGDKGTATSSINVQDYITQEFGLPIDNSELILRLQITDSAYKEVTVTGLTHTNIISGISIVTTLTDIAGDADNHNLVIPINYSIARRLPLFERNILYQEGALLRINAYVSQHLDWYETNMFSTIIMIVTFVIAIYTGQAWVAYLGTLATVSSIILYVLFSILVTIGLQVVFTWVAKELGPEWAAVIAIVTAIIAIAWPPAGTVGFGVAQIPTAQLCLMSSMALLDSSQQEFERLRTEMENKSTKMQEDYEEKFDELEALWEELNPENLLSFDLLSLSNPYYTISNETPDDFYNRTIHRGNMGALSLGALTNYYDISLQLPKPR